MQKHRLAAGGRIDRTRPISFTFDGRTLHGYVGDTLASALLANGVRLVGRSFKYHRPRGILSAGPEEPNALVEIGTAAKREPNTRATVAELSPGLVATSQNRFPSLRTDLLAVTGTLAPFFAAGFYYKTFMWPPAFWERVYEPLIRRAAGLGRASGLPDPDTYEKQTAFADLLVIGAGPAGIAAALAAAERGVRVILADQDFSIGGRLLADHRQIDGAPAAAWLAASLARLATNPNVRILTRTTVTGVYDGGTYAAVERVSDHLAPGAPGPRQRLWRVVASQAVLATGSIERPLVFPGNDLPGVMLAGAVRTYINRFAVQPGTRAVVFANNDDAASTIADLTAAGITVAALVDPRPAPSDTLQALATGLGIRIVPATTIARASGGLTLRRVILANGTRLECDLLAMSGGWSPTIHLASHHGARPVWNPGRAAFTPGKMPPGMRAVGAAAGQFLLAEAVGRPTGPELPPDAATTPARAVHGKKAFVDFQNDVTASDISLAANEGFSAVEHLKRYTTLGMATDGGKTSNVTGAALIAGATGRTIAESGTTVFRPPYTPVAIGALAGAHRGRHWRPSRRTPAHDWATDQGAVFQQFGEWQRALRFPRDGETSLQTTTREVRAVRNAAGFCDVSTLGKIDVQGPDAATFLDFVYANAVASLKLHRVRYGIMLREDGFLLDDGTIARRSQTHFLLSTTSANAIRVLHHLDHCHQVLRPELAVAFEPVTDQWAQFAIAGPQSRAILQTLQPASAIDNAALPPMGWLETTITLPGQPPVEARLFRVTFSGALGFELAVSASHGEALARHLGAAGATAYGLDALDVMRLEKGHVVGAELNGQTTAADLGLGKMVRGDKDFIGRALARRPALTAPDRARLVGLRPVATGASFQAGAHLIPAGREATAANDQGHVTSAAWSPTLGHWIGLGLLAGGPARIGEIVQAANPLQNTITQLEVVSPIFHDPEGLSQRG